MAKNRFLNKSNRKLYSSAYKFIHDKTKIKIQDATSKQINYLKYLCEKYNKPLTDISISKQTATRMIRELLSNDNTQSTNTNTST